MRRDHARFMRRGRGTGMGSWPMPVKRRREGCVESRRPAGKALQHDRAPRRK
ncbi:MAG: hypothetical protein WAM10_12925 [Methylocella sp.]